MVSHRRVWIDLLLYPTHTFPTAAAPVAVAIGLAVADGVWSPAPALVAFLASWLIHVGGVFIDNHELLARHRDNREHPDLLQALAEGRLSLTMLRVAIALAFAAPLLAAPWLWRLGGWPVALLGVLGVVTSASYAGGPLPYARKGLADIVFFLMFGVVAVVGVYYIQAMATAGPGADPGTILRAMPLKVWLAGLPVGALVVNVLLIDDMRDEEPDRDKGWRTGTVVFGQAFTRTEYVLLSLFAYAAIIIVWLVYHQSGWTLLPLATLPFAVLIGRRVAGARTSADLVPYSARAAILSLAFGVLQGVGAALGG